MFSYSDEKKRIIGILCCDKLDAVIRDNKGRPPEYIYNDRQNKLCTWRTWKKIASGNVSPNDDLYDFLMKKTGNTWAELHEAEEIELNVRINTILDQLLFYAEKGDYSEMDKPCNELINLVSSFNNAFYYKDLYHAVLNIQKSFVYEEYIETMYFDLYMRILNCFPNTIQALLKNAMFQYAAYFIGDISLIEQVVIKFDFEHSQHFLKIKYGQLMMYQGNHINAYQIFTELEDLYIEQKNFAYLLEVYNMKTSLSNVSSKNEIERLEHRILGIIQNHGSQISKNKIANTYYMQGMRHFNRKNFKDASICLQNYLLTRSKSRERECNIFLVYLRKMCKVDNPLDDFDEFLHYTDNTTATVCYRYFVMKKDGIDYETLAQYILQNIINSFDSNSIFYFEIFKEEITEIARILKKHKYLTVYIKKIDRIKKNIR